MIRSQQQQIPEPTYNIIPDLAKTLPHFDGDVKQKHYATTAHVSQLKSWGNKDKIDDGEPLSDNSEDHRSNGSELKTTKPDRSPVAFSDHFDNVEIQGIHKSQSEYIETLVISVGKALDVDISQADIDNCHRLRSPAGQEYPATIVCKFVWCTTKEDLLRNRKVKVYFCGVALTQALDSCIGNHVTKCRSVRIVANDTYAVFSRSLPPWIPRLPAMHCSRSVGCGTNRCDEELPEEDTDLSDVEKHQLSMKYDIVLEEDIWSHLQPTLLHCQRKDKDRPLCHSRTLSGFIREKIAKGLRSKAPIALRRDLADRLMGDEDFEPSHLPKLHILHQMISQRHDIPAIERWLTDWQRKGAKKPDVVVTDFSLALIGTVTRAFTNFSSTNDYFPLVWRYLLRTFDTRRAHWGFSVVHSVSERSLDCRTTLYRHGDRTPLDPYPNDPFRNTSLWPVGWGQLTPVRRYHHISPLKIETVYGFPRRWLLRAGVDDLREEPSKTAQDMNTCNFGMWMDWLIAHNLIPIMSHHGGHWFKECTDSWLLSGTFLFFVNFLVTCKTLLDSPMHSRTALYIRVFIGQHLKSSLNAEGAKQQYLLGKWLRQRYIDFLPAKYDAAYIHIRSTDVDRTLMSAESNLAGLYPPVSNQQISKELKWQPIPIHTIPESLDYRVIYMCETVFSALVTMKG
uniref:acid phosphatase n=1 Tax=Timema monikensis TaxID=170555 RepID=A0A7R9HNY1_9NEOP|nr:unnamed protein product [Timema monikensis]